MPKRGSKIVLLYSDNWLNKQNIIGDFYRDLFLIADSVVFPTQGLMNLAGSNIPKNTKTIIIQDPWQLRHWHDPRPLPVGRNQIIKLIWFGSNLNIEYLLSVLPSILSINATDNIFELTILGAPWSLIKCQQFVQSNPTLFTCWRLRLVSWDASDQPNQLESELTRAHLCIIPSDPENPAKAGVSPNRIVDAIRGGCITVASPMESYKDLSEISLQGTDIRNLLIKALRNYKEVALTIMQRREFLMEKYSPQKNRESWRNFWLMLLEEGSEKHQQ